MGHRNAFHVRAAMALAIGTYGADSRADLTHDAVSGIAVARVTLRAESPAGGEPTEIAWADLSSPKKPGPYTVRFQATGEAVLIPHCNGREQVLVDGASKDRGSKGPLVLPLSASRSHEIAITINVSSYEKRIACTEPPRVGASIKGIDGLSLMRFSSPDAARGGGQAVVFVPGGHDRNKPATVLVGTHPWNGSPWTYAAYRELIEEAGRRDVVLLMPSGLGNSLYVADAEDEVLRAIEALAAELAIDRQRVSIWGASMGGAGATTIAFHHPDRFAFVASYFGDSRYDLTTYVKRVLDGEAGAHRVNALDVVENARHLPVLLVHGEEDRTSPMKQSTMLYDAMTKAGFSVELERVAGMGHEGPLVVKFIQRVVARASAAVAPTRPSHVSFRSVRAEDTEAYGVRIVRSGSADAFVDLERRSDGVHVLAAQGAAEIVLSKGALGSETTTVTNDVGTNVRVRWAP